MSVETLLRIELKYEHDIVLARQRARQIAALLGFESQDQVRIATVMSEIARNAFQYGGAGKVEFQLIKDRLELLQVRVTDQGPGIENLKTILDGQYVSRTGMGLGLVGARRLMDEFSIESEPGKSTCVTFGKYIPATTPLHRRKSVDIASSLAAQLPQDPFSEIQQQNQELLKAMETLEQQRRAMEQLNSELEETNRGVVALYAELDERADYLRRASELKTQFLSNMTHEFRTPLNAILSISQLLLSRLDGELTQEQEKQVHFIQAGASSLSDLVNDLLDLAKVEAGKIIIRPTQFEVSTMFGMLRGMLKPLLEANTSISLVFEEPEASLPPMYSDEGKISQILRNLLSNAIKYTERGEVRLHATLNDTDHIAFSVTDTGIGILPEDMQHIFQEFSQVEDMRASKTKGTGLGLPLSRKLAELLQGSISVESTPEIGSTFTVTLPLHYQGPDEGIVFKGTSKPVTLRQILVIDDSESDRYVLHRLLTEMQFQVLEAENGIEGIYMARKALPDLILLDLNMPDLDGYEVLDQLEKDAKTCHIPVIINSANSLTSEQEHLLQTKAALILSKDVTLASVNNLQSLARQLESAASAWQKEHHG